MATDDIWIPSYYRQRHPFLWVRAAGGPQVVDWVCGAVFAVLVLGLVTLVRAPHQAQPSAAVVATATTPNSDTNADRVAYASQVSAVNK